MTSPTDAQIEAVARAMFEQSPYRNQALHWEDAVLCSIRHKGCPAGPAESPSQGCELMGRFPDLTFGQPGPQVSASSRSAFP